MIPSRDEDLLGATQVSLQQGFRPHHPEVDIEAEDGTAFSPDQATSKDLSPISHLASAGLGEYVPLFMDVNGGLVDQVMDYSYEESVFSYVSACHPGLPLEMSFDILPSWKRVLLSNCKYIEMFLLYVMLTPPLVSDSIATEMAAFDGAHNSWRHLILPFAHADDLVMDAILTSSAYHMSITNPHSWSLLCEDQSCLTPERLYMNTIKGLQRRGNLWNYERLDQFSVLLTLLILLTTVMITGNSDFPMVIKSLQSALDAIGGEESLGDSEIATFLKREIHE